MKITLSQAIEGYELAAYARKLSPQTLSDNRNSFGKFGAWLGKDQELEEISADDIRAFLVSQNGIAAKTLPNFHRALSALWRWANQERIVEGNIDRASSRPSPTRRRSGATSALEMIQPRRQAGRFSRRAKTAGSPGTISIIRSSGSVSGSGSPAPTSTVPAHLRDPLSAQRRQPVLVADEPRAQHDGDDQTLPGDCAG
jgi:hypothetical protein